MKRYLTILPALALVLVFAQCRKAATVHPLEEVLPETPVYSEADQWYITDRHADADIFYIISTETGDYHLADGTLCHYADTHNDSVRGPMHDEMVGVDALLSGDLNFFTPYYRQCSLQTFMSDSTMQARLPIARDDVRRAFKHYLKHQNGGRPFVLAGFSQGAMIMLDLIKEMDNATYKRMIAAYAFGITIGQDELDASPHIVAAQGPDDTGVTICINSVRDASCAMTGWEHNDVAINPVNWRTDATPATLITEPSPLIPLDEQRKDTLTVTLDKPSGLLFVKGYSATDYIIPLIGKEGCYHSREIWLYRDQLRNNIALRTARYLKQTTNL